ncbi:MAG: STAS domain-containing protein [Thiotrichales bacterium]|nr:STAS domain-containing protein [Thiotrichales bacterium]
MAISYQQNINLLYIQVQDSVGVDFNLQLSHTLREKVSSKTLLMLDFAKVEFFGSHLLGYIIGAYQAVGLQASRLKLINVSDDVLAILQSVKFDAMFDIHRSA